MAFDAFFLSAVLAEVEEKCLLILHNMNPKVRSSYSVM